MSWKKRKDENHKTTRQIVEENRRLDQQRHSRRILMFHFLDNTRLNLGIDEYVVHHHHDESIYTVTYVEDRDIPWDKQQQHHQMFPISSLKSVLVTHRAKEDEE